MWNISAVQFDESLPLHPNMQVCNGLQTFLNLFDPCLDVVGGFTFRIF